MILGTASAVQSRRLERGTNSALKTPSSFSAASCKEISCVPSLPFSALSRHFHQFFELRSLQRFSFEPFVYFEG